VDIIWNNLYWIYAITLAVVLSIGVTIFCWKPLAKIKLKPISLRASLILGACWLATMLVAGIFVGILRESFMTGLIFGLLVAMVIRLICILVLRFVFGIDHQRIGCSN